MTEISTNFTNSAFQFGNFNPMDVQTDNTINAVFVVDVSPSIGNYEKDLNTAFQEFLIEMKGSHVADSLMVKVIEFNEDVTERSGFQPITLIQPNSFNFKGHGRSTALYDGVKLGIERAVEYRNDLENTGINVKTFVFIITDGEDMSSKYDASEVKKLLTGVLAKEQNAFSFTTIMFGVGQPQYFQAAKEDMGIQHLGVVGTSAKDIRKMIGFISQSVSKSQSNTPAFNF